MDKSKTSKSSKKAAHQNKQKSSRKTVEKPSHKIRTSNKHVHKKTTVSTHEKKNTHSSVKTTAHNKPKTETHSQPNKSQDKAFKVTTNHPIPKQEQHREISTNNPTSASTQADPPVEEKQEAEKEVEKVTTQPSQKPRRSRFATFLASLSFLLAIVAIAGVGYSWYQFNQTKLLAKSATQQLQTRLQQTQTIVNQQQQALANTQNELNKLLRLKDQRASHWVIAEAAYYVRLANLNLTIEGNVPVAVKLLQAADAKIHSLNDPALVTVRRAIVQDITALQAAPKVDVGGLLLRIESLSNEASKLPLIPPISSKTALDQTAPQNAKETSAWKRAWHNSLQTLKSLVIIRHHQKPVGPLVAPEQQTYLIDNIQMKLAQAQWAVLNRQPKIYLSSLQQAANWIRRYFVLESSATQSVLNELSALEKVDIKPKLPSLNASIAAIQAVSAQSISAAHETATNPSQPSKNHKNQTDTPGKEAMKL